MRELSTSMEFEMPQGDIEFGSKATKGFDNTLSGKGK